MFYTPRFEEIPKIIAAFFLVCSILVWFLSKKYVTTYSVLMIIYSVVFMTMIGLMCLFFPPETLIFIVVLLVVVFNYLLSIFMFRESVKEKE